MDVYTKKVVSLTNEEKDILRKAAEIMGRLNEEIYDCDFNHAETILINTYNESIFTMEINE